MNILYVSHSFGAWGSNDQIWDRNLKETLRQMGHHLLEPKYDPNKAHEACSHDPSGQARRYYSEKFLESVRSLLAEGSLDLIFTYFDNRNVLPEILDEVRGFGMPTVNFFCNAAHEFYKVEQVAAHFDYCIVPEKVALEAYRSVGANPIHLQMAANPRFYKPIELPVQYPVSFIGTKYLNREAHLLRLFQAGIDVHTFGAHWPLYKPSLSDVKARQIPRRVASLLVWPFRMRWRQFKGRQLPIQNYHGPISDDEMIRVFNQSQIVLGLSDVIDSSGVIMRHIRLRDFEAPMCGAFYLTGYQEELGEYYEIGEEIVCYDTLDELADKALYYLAHENERRAIAQAGYQRALSEHTWENRFNQLFREIGLAG